MPLTTLILILKYQKKKKKLHPHLENIFLFLETSFTPLFQEITKFIKQFKTILLKQHDAQNRGKDFAE